jgi:diaminohydroxyphosphoribosylaminopyrimidine deaminase/5-amino-6-(5-phosphoribosylamino)uracil reductase
MSAIPTDAQQDRDAGFMRRALELAARGWGRTWPNPMVGAVVVQDGRIVGEGWHREYGQPHAEVNALAQAGEAARGATLYVTLEPCAHHGQTPPCTEAVARAAIARLVYAAEDPSAEAGGGGARLRERGLDVRAGVERAAARLQNAMFFHVLEMRSPFVALKYALSLDARLAAKPGRPTQVTGPAAREEAHRLRAGYDAIVVGIGTVLADDPRLTVRGPVAPRVAPARVVVDTEARLPLESALVRSVAEAPVWCLCAPDAPRQRRESLVAAGVHVLPVARRPGDDGLDLATALGALWDAGLRALFVEGGGRLGSALLDADQVDRLDLFLAPVLLGDGGVAAFPPSPLGPAAARGSWTLVRTAAFADDVLVELQRDRSGGPPPPAGGGA